MLSAKDFQDFDTFFIDQAKKYHLLVEQPVINTLASIIKAHLPVPAADSTTITKVILWRMQRRYWAFNNTPDDKSNKNRIGLYVLYHQGAAKQALAHSLGYAKSLIGIIGTYADTEQNAQNAIVMTDEILHTVATNNK